MALFRKLYPTATVIVSTVQVRSRINSASFCINCSRTNYSTENRRERNNLSLNEIFSLYHDKELVPIHVKSIGELGLSFSNADAHAFPYCIDKNNNIVDPKLTDYKQCLQLESYSVDFKDLFHDGLKTVEHIISGKATGLPLPSEAHLLQSIETLDLFFQNKEYHEQCLFDMALDNKTYTELQTTILLANHLFAPLVTADDEFCQCIITKDSEFKTEKCPCSNKCDTPVEYGKSGFGSRYLWFGRSDIVLCPNGGGSVGIIVKDKVMTRKHQKYIQSRELKRYKHQLRTHKSVAQAVAQTVTFSLFQRKCQKEQKRKENITTLIPFIFASRHYFDVYLYDPENDVLLRNLGGPISIFEKCISEDAFHPKFRLSSVLQLWMLINHSLLQPKLSGNHIDKLQGTCGITKQIEALDLKDKIEDSLTTSCTFDPPRLREIFQVNKIHI